MFNRLARAVLAATVVGLAPVAAASAGGGPLPVALTSCSAGSLQICINYQLTSIGGQNYSLTYAVTSVNLNGQPRAGFFITSVGLLNAGAGTFAGGAVNQPGWTFSNGSTGNCSDLSNFGGLQFCDATNGNSGISAITFTFSFTGNVNALSVADVASHVQSISQTVGGGTCSAKPLTDVQTQTTGVTTVPATDCTSTGGPPPTTSSPEPASLLLVGTGLAGLGGIVRRRRRRA